MRHQSINCHEKFSLFSEHWAPKVIAQLNEYQFKLVKICGEFVWHTHDDTDEAFFVLSGAMVIELRDGSVPIEAGELFVVPRGVEHRPVADEECQIMLIEPAGVINTGINTGEADGRTAPNDVWI